MLLTISLTRLSGFENYLYLPSRSILRGVALELTPDNGFNKKDAPKKFLLSDLIGKIYGLRLALVQVILLAMALEIFSMIPAC